MNNYLCINGKKAELTEEQLVTLGLKKREESLWIVEEEKFRIPSCATTDSRYKIACPKCGRYFFTRVRFNESMFHAHRYCGYCGNKNFREVD